MSMKICEECGHSVSTKAFSCPSCGVVFSPYPNMDAVKKQSGRGLGVAGMIIGIMSALYALIILFIDVAVVFWGTELREPNFLVVVPIFYSLVYFIFGLLAFVFGLAARSQGFKRTESAAAVVLGAINLAVCIGNFCAGFLLLWTNRS